jgi:hypothetical protein
LLFAGVGCGSAGGSESQGLAESHHPREARRQRAQRQAAVRHARAHAHREAARRHARRVRRERERREHREQAEEERAEAAAEEVESNCDPNYSGACLDPTASDYDCEGGSGNGPYYTGTVTVVGEDHYGLDADGDGVGCEPY